MTPKNCVLIMEKDTRYARIIDAGECYKTLTIVIDGVYANEKTWDQYGFIPHDGMVGELIDHHSIPVIKVKDRIYVPISEYGFKIISEEEYKRSKETGTSVDSRFPFMDPKQLDALIGREEFSSAYDKSGFAPMDFQSAIEDYCYDASRYLASMGDDLHPRIKSMIRQLENQEVEQYPYKTIISTFACWIKEEMAKYNWMPDDYKGAAWLCCIYAEAYVKSLGDLSVKDFKDVFSDLLKQYHDTMQ